MADEEENHTLRYVKLTKKLNAQKAGKEMGDDENQTMSIEEDEEEPVSPASQLLRAPGFDIHIVFMMGLKIPATDTDTPIKGLQETLLKHPRFSSILVTNGNKQDWKRTRIDIDNHVFIPDLDPGMDSPDKFVEDYSSSLSTIPMDFTKPLWELHILNVPTSDAKATIIFKIHHSMGDGVSLMALLLACTRKSSDLKSLPTLPSNKEKVGFKIRKSNMFSLWMVFFLIWMNIVLVINTLVDCTMFLMKLMFFKDTATPIKGQGYGVEMCPKRFVHRIVSLEDVKLVKNVMNVTINDVILGVTQAGLSLYLNREYEKQTKERSGNIQKRNYLPRDLRVTGAVIFNNRSSPIIEDLAGLIKKTSAKGIWGNILGYVLLPLALTLQDDPLTYIHQAKTIIDRKKLSLEAKCTFLASQLVLKLLGVKPATATMQAVFSNTTFTFSNMVGPQEEVTFYGYPISYISPSVSGLPQALTLHYQSYDNKLIISMAVDEDVISDPHQLCDDLENSLRDMKVAIMNRSKLKDI